MSDKVTWLDWVHPLHADRAGRWQMVSDFYSGEVLDEDKITSYLIQKATAENDTSFQERSALADYTNHLATIVDSLAGIMFAVEGDANRVWGAEDDGSAWGDVEDRKTVAGRLWVNANGAGEGWLTFWKRLTIELILNQLAWVLVDTAVNGDPIVKLWPAMSVVNWTDDFSHVLCLEEVDMRPDLQNVSPEDGFQERWIYFTPDGWSRWRKDDEGNAVKISDGTYDYRDQLSGKRIPPIFPAILPLDRHVGWSLAKKAKAIFNKESERDHLLRFGSFPKLRVVGNDDQYSNIVGKLAQGINTMQDHPEFSKSHGFIAPDTSPATLANETLERKVTEFYATAFREFGDSARERTATEVRQEVSSGVGAFLQLLASAVDDAENMALGLIGQAEWPRDAKKHWAATVERSEDYLPPDLDTIIDKKRKRYFGETGTVPTGITTLTETVRDIVAWDGLNFYEEEVKTALTIDQLNKLVPLFDSLPLTEELQAQLAFDLVKALGKVPEGEEEAVLAAMMQKADERRRQRELLAQSFTAFEPQPGGGQLPPGQTPEDEEE